MNGRSMLIVATMALVLAILTGVAMSAQDKYTLRVPDGLAFSDFKGYEDWQLISSAKTDDRMKVILGNPTIIAAYKSGIPGNGSRSPTVPRSRRSSGNRRRARKPRSPWKCRTRLQT